MHLWTSEDLNNMEITLRNKRKCSFLYLTRRQESAFKNGFFKRIWDRLCQQIFVNKYSLA